MKRLLLLLFIFCSAFFTVNAQSWLWGRGGLGTPIAGSGDSWTSAADDSGNVYFVNGSYHLVKYNGSGVFQHSYLGPPDILSMCTDKWNNLYIVGALNYLSTPFIIGTYTLTTKSADMVLLKYNSSGSLIWARQSKVPSTASSVSFDTYTYNSICADNSGNVFITGSFHDSIYFASQLLITTAFYNDYLAKYDSSGNVIWVKKSATKSPEVSQGMSVSTDNLGNIYEAGQMSDTVLFGADSVIGSSYLVKYSPSGNVIWAKGLSCQLCEMNADGAGSCYLTGPFTFNITIGSFNYYSNNWDYYLTKFNTNGEVSWAKFGNPGPGTSFVYDGQGSSVCTDGCGNVYLAFGVANGNVFNKIIPYIIYLGNDTIVDSASDPVYVLQYDTASNLICYNHLYSGGDDEAAVSSDNLGNVYLCGDFMNSPLYTHPPFIVGPDTLIDSLYPWEYGFIAKWQACPHCNSNEGINKIVDKNNWVKIYPNPNNGLFEIEISKEESEIKNTLEIYNMLGEKVYTKPLRQAQGDNTIDLSGKPSGVYLYRIITETRDLVSAGKFIIE